MSRIKEKIQEIAEDKGIEFDEVSQEMFLECLIQEERKAIYSKNRTFVGWVRSLKSLHELNSNLLKLKSENKNISSSKKSVFS